MVQPSAGLEGRVTQLRRSSIWVMRYRLLVVSGQSSGDRPYLTALPVRCWSRAIVWRPTLPSRAACSLYVTIAITYPATTRA